MNKFHTTAILLFAVTAAFAQGDFPVFKTNINTSAESWLKKHAGYTVAKDTVVALDSTESYRLVYDFEKDKSYKLAAIANGEVNLTLQLEDIALGAEVYAPGNKDEKGNTLAESDLSLSENVQETINVITIGGGIGMPCRYLILKKK